MLRKTFTLLITFFLSFAMLSCQNDETEKDILTTMNLSDVQEIHKEQTSPQEQNSMTSQKIETSQTKLKKDSATINPQQMIGVSVEPLIHVSQDDWGIKLSGKSITATRMTITISQQDGSPTGELMTNSFYTIEKLTNNEWIEVEPIVPKEEITFTDEAFPILMNQTTELNLDWTGFYGALPEGKYRVGKEITDFRQTSDYDTKMYYVMFDLQEINETTHIHYQDGEYGITVPYILGFEYVIKEYSPDSEVIKTGELFSIHMNPLNESGFISISYFSNFGACESGIEIEDKGNIKICTTKDNPFWSFMTYKAKEGYFVIMNKSSGDWFQRYEEQIMSAIDEIEFMGLAE